MAKVSVQEFRGHFTEFADTTIYPNPLICFWIDVAEKLLPANRWGNMLSVGVELYAAHNIVLEAQAQKAANAGGIPGAVTGNITNKHVDKVTIGYDTTNSINPDAGHWNLTTYGNRFYRLMMMFGAGPIQVGAGPGFVPPLSSAEAWTGPDVFPGFTNFGS
jgi:hypothetical protein